MSNEIDPQLQSLIDSLEDYLDYKGAWSDKKRTRVVEDIQAYAQERVEARVAGIVRALDLEKQSAIQQGAQQKWAIASLVWQAREEAHQKDIDIVKRST